MKTNDNVGICTCAQAKATTVIPSWRWNRLPDTLAGRLSQLLGRFYPSHSELSGIASCKIHSALKCQLVPPGITRSFQNIDFTEIEIISQFPICSRFEQSQAKYGFLALIFCTRTYFEQVLKHGFPAPLFVPMQQRCDSESYRKHTSLTPYTTH